MNERVSPLAPVFDPTCPHHFRKPDVPPWNRIHGTLPYYYKTFQNITTLRLSLCIASPQLTFLREIGDKKSANTVNHALNSASMTRTAINACIMHLASLNEDEALLSSPLSST